MTSTNQPLLPAIALRSIAGGMILMALLTCAWINLACIGLSANEIRLLWYCLSGVYGVGLIGMALYFFRQSRHFPRLRSKADKEEGRRMGMWYGIIFGGEGLVIGAVCTALGLTGHSNYILPTTALIIGLHFYPMAWLFKRTVDFYIATWTCGVGIAGLYLVSKGTDTKFVFLVTGFGVAMATAAYGLYMVAAGYKMVRSRLLTPP